jgi:hypothetical protein
LSSLMIFSLRLCSICAWVFIVDCFDSSSWLLISSCFSFRDWISPCNDLICLSLSFVFD